MGTDIHGIFQKRTEEGWEDVETEYDERRHYALFAWLGNVRNGRGFAGVLTHNRIDPLSSDRGFPEGFAVRGDYNSDHPISRNSLRGRRAKTYASEDADPSSECHLLMWMGDHSYSWLSCDEILNTTPPRIIRTGIVSIWQFREWDGESSPEEWCGGVGGDSVTLASSPSEVTEKTTHVRIEWLDDCAEFAYFINEVRRLRDLHGEVRFVFGFDS